MTALWVPLGPPGCGKSSLAEALQRSGQLQLQAVVSPDDYRALMTGDRACQDANRYVFEVVHRIVKTRLRHGLDVYLDATNLTAVSNADMKELIFSAWAWKVDVTYVHFTVPLEELQRRNSVRRHPVPEDVLERMHRRYTTTDYSVLEGQHVNADELLV